MYRLGICLGGCAGRWFIAMGMGNLVSAAVAEAEPCCTASPCCMGSSVWRTEQGGKVEERHCACAVPWFSETYGIQLDKQ